MIPRSDVPVNCKNDPKSRVYKRELKMENNIACNFLVGLHDIM